MGFFLTNEKRLKQNFPTVKKTVKIKKNKLLTRQMLWHDDDYCISFDVCQPFLQISGREYYAITGCATQKLTIFG